MLKDGILIVSNSYDESPNQVTAELKRLGAQFYRFDTDTYPLGKSLEISLRGERITGGLKDETGRELIRWESIKTVWFRRPRLLALDRPGVPEGYLRFIGSEASAALWALWTNLDAFWVNPPTVTVLLEHNKLYQQRIARQVGLQTPDTVITNDPEELLGLCGRHNGIIAVKQLRGELLVREDDLQTLFIYTQMIDRNKIAQHKDDVRLAPVLAQEYIPKKLELRVTIVGKKVFSCAIYSQASEVTRHDWRRYADLKELKHEQYPLPSDIECKLLDLMERLGLKFGAIDLVLDPSDRYVFLEVNPSGQWGWIEEFTKMPISSAVCQLLMQGDDA